MSLKSSKITQILMHDLLIPKNRNSNESYAVQDIVLNILLHYCYYSIVLQSNI